MTHSETEDSPLHAENTFELSIYGAMRLEYSGFMKILVTALSGLGNAIMSVPMVDSITQLSPQRLDILAASNVNAEIFASRKGITSTQTLLKAPSGLVRQLLTLRRVGYDFLFIPFPANRFEYNLLAFVLGASRRVIHKYPVGRYRNLSFLANAQVPAHKGLHDVEQNMLLLRALGIAPPPKPCAPQILVSMEHKREAQDLLVNIGLKSGEKFIVVHPGTAKTGFAEAKCWDGNKYLELCQALREMFSIPVIMIDGPDERNAAREICKRSSAFDIPLLSLSGHIGIAAAVLEQSILYVGSDSGLSHLAAAVGTKAVTIFGPADPQRVSPFGNQTLVARPLCDRFPCFRYPFRSSRPSIDCKPPFCINSISVETVSNLARIAMSDTTSS